MSEKHLAALPVRDLSHVDADHARGGSGRVANPGFRGEGLDDGGLRNQVHGRMPGGVGHPQRGDLVAGPVQGRAQRTHPGRLVEFTGAVVHRGSARPQWRGCLYQSHGGSRSAHAGGGGQGVLREKPGWQYRRQRYRQDLRSRQLCQPDGHAGHRQPDVSAGRLYLRLAGSGRGRGQRQ